MVPRPPCLDDPADLLKQGVCLHDISKNVTGPFPRLPDDAPPVLERCTDAERCQTAKARHPLLTLTATANAPCDSDEAKALSGDITVRDFTHAFRMTAQNRGVHAGTFEWAGKNGIKAVGSMSGITNAGIQRTSGSDSAGTCDERDWMEGRLCGHVEGTTHQTIEGCWLVAIYRLHFKSSASGGGAQITGIIEGALLCPCELEKPKTR